jgi:hypothetical protein
MAKQYIDLNSAPDEFFSWMTLFPALQGAISPPATANFTAQAVWDFSTTNGRNLIHTEIKKRMAANPNTSYLQEYDAVFQQYVLQEQD